MLKHSNILKHAQKNRTFVVGICKMKIALFGCISCIWLLGLKTYAQSDTSKYQLLWEIKPKNGATTSYLFGSMHSNDTRMFDFPDSLYVGFVKAQTVVVETDVAALFETYDVRLDPFLIDLIDNTKDKEGTRTVYGSEDGRPQFLDAYFQELGYASGKKVLTLETFEQQLVAATEPTTSNINLSPVQYSEEMFKQAYLQGDIVALTKMLKAQLKGQPGAYERLISDRNLKMAAGLDSLMRKANVFCAIGSGHLYGSDGVIQILKNKGFAVRRILPTHHVPCPEKETMKTYPMYLHRNENLHFQIELSGKPIESKDNGFYKAIYTELGQGNTYEIHVSPGESDLEGCKTEFLVNRNYQIEEVTLPNGTLAIEGVVKSKLLGYQWKRVFVQNGHTYELICYGGNKFMHSKRAQSYFNRFQTLQK